MTTIRKSKPIFFNRECSMRGCETWENYYENGRFCEECLRCGFYPEEASRRKKIPLTKNEQGLLRKVITNKDFTINDKKGTENYAEI